MLVWPVGDWRDSRGNGTCPRAAVRGSITRAITTPATATAVDSLIEADSECTKVSSSASPTCRAVSGELLQVRADVAGAEVVHEPGLLRRVSRRSPSADSEPLVAQRWNSARPRRRRRCRRPSGSSRGCPRRAGLVSSTEFMAAVDIGDITKPIPSPIRMKVGRIWP